MGAVFVARSAKLGDWGSDVGLSKHLYKLGYTEEPAKPFVASAAWCGETDWTLVKTATADIASEEEMIHKVAAKVKMVDTAVYPRLKGTIGIFKVTLQQVENNMLLARALAGEPELAPAKVKPADYANFLLAVALR